MCTINNISGDYSNCRYMLDHMHGPGDIAINAEQSFAYIANIDDDQIIRCYIDPQSEYFTRCQSTGSDFHQPETIALSPFGQYALIGNEGNGRVSICSIQSSDGSLHDCKESPIHYDGLGKIRFYPLGQEEVYIPLSNENKLIHCRFDIRSGQLYQCTDVGKSYLNYPAGIAFMKIELQKS